MSKWAAPAPPAASRHRGACRPDRGHRPEEVQRRGCRGHSNCRGRPARLAAVRCRDRAESVSRWWGPRRPAGQRIGRKPPMSRVREAQPRIRRPGKGAGRRGKQEWSRSKSLRSIRSPQSLRWAGQITRLMKAEPFKRFSLAAVHCFTQETSQGLDFRNYNSGRRTRHGSRALNARCRIGGNGRGAEAQCSRQDGFPGGAHGSGRLGDTRKDRRQRLRRISRSPRTS